MLTMPKRQLYILAFLTLFHPTVYAQGDLTLTPQTLNFGDTYLGQPEPILNITVENIGDQPVNFNVPILGDFSWVGTGCFPTQLDPGDSCIQSISFVPTTPGLVSQDVELVSDAPDSPDIFTLTGNALASAIQRDQGQIFGTDGVVTVASDTLSQSITTGLSGKLVSIQIQYNGPGLSPAPPLSFSIVDGGNPPVGDVLYGELLELGELTPGALISWDLTEANLFFDIGDQFTFVFRTANNSIFGDIAGNDPPGYDGGELFLNGVALPADAVNDIAFITYVDTAGATDGIGPEKIPTLGTWGLTLTICLLILLGALQLRSVKKAAYVQRSGKST
jgi:hypothetical protein